MRFTIEEFQNYVKSLESYNDIKDLYSSEQILKANLNINDKIWIPKGNAGVGCYGTISHFIEELIFFKEFDEGVFISELISDKIDKIDKL